MSKIEKLTLQTVQIHISCSLLATLFGSTISAISQYDIARPRGYKTFSMLNSVEHEILNAHKNKNIKKFGLFKVQISLEGYFSRS